MEFLCSVHPNPFSVLFIPAAKKIQDRAGGMRTE